MTKTSRQEFILSFWVVDQAAVFSLNRAELHSHYSYAGRYAKCLERQYRYQASFLFIVVFKLHYSDQISL